MTRASQPTVRRYSVSIRVQRRAWSSPAASAAYWRATPMSARARTARRCRGRSRGTARIDRAGRARGRPARRALAVRIERGPEAEPARQVDPGLRPGEDPRDRPKLGDRRTGLFAGAAPAAARPRAAGRDPSRSVAISSIGVTSRKNATNPGSSIDQRSDRRRATWPRARRGSAGRPTRPRRRRRVVLGGRRKRGRPRSAPRGGGVRSQGSA